MSTNLRAHTFIVAVLLCAVIGGPAASPKERPGLEELFEAYAGGQFDIVEQRIGREHFAAGARPLVQEADAVILRWQNERRRTVAAFLLEVAHVGLLRLQQPSALEILASAREVVMSRPHPPGHDPDEDAFEILFHQTAVALMFGRLPAEGLGREALRPLRQRVVAEPQGRGGARLVDPWIALAEALVEERRTQEDAPSLPRLARNTLERFDRAAQYPANRPEALARKAWLLIRLGRHTDALDTIEALGDPAAIEGRTIQYWTLLFRGRASEALGRADEAEAAYREALAVVPAAQTPMAALAALEIGRGRQASAADWAARGRAASPDDDPWLDYGVGEYRLFAERRTALREMSR